MLSAKVDDPHAEYQHHEGSGRRRVSDIADVSANWARDHPWATVYQGVLDHDRLSISLGWLLFHTDMRLLGRAAAAIDQVPDAGAILDIPCGGGVALRGLEPGRDVRYVAADISAAMLQRTASRARDRGLEQVETRIADVQSLPFADGEFDLCLCYAGLHCFPDPARAVAEIARCLHPGGRLVGSAFTNDSGVRYLPHRLVGRAMGVLGPSGTSAELEGWFASAGLEDTRLQSSGALVYFEARR